MNRDKLPPPPEVQKKIDPSIIWQERHYRVITALYGGGVTPEKADPVTIIRGSEVRGNLRFWWRATRGGSYPEIEDMRDQEREIWGSEAGEDLPGPSQVKIIISVSDDERGEEIYETNQGVEVGHPRSKIGYVAWPLQEQRERQKPAGAVRTNVAFTLKIRYPKLFEAEIQAALWAWETFGGIGARTRRGFGALALDSVNGQAVPLLSIRTAKKQVLDGLNLHVVDGTWPEGVSHLRQKLRYKITIKRNGDTDPPAVWEDLIKGYKQFRQKRSMKRINNTEKPYGRSKWPEPDQIRRETGEDHENEKHPPENPVKKFPRGQFGLPIIFHFKSGNPEDAKLKLADHDRLSSPLILRPLACANGQSVGLIAILEREGELPGQIILETPNKKISADISLTPTDANNLPFLNGHTDVLDAFLEYINRMSDL